MIYFERKKLVPDPDVVVVRWVEIRSGAESVRCTRVKHRIIRPSAKCETNSRPSGGRRGQYILVDDDEGRVEDPFGDLTFTPGPCGGGRPRGFAPFSSGE